ncbi:MAG: hypothetical protein ACREL1_06755, partial [bacterium]
MRFKVGPFSWLERNPKSFLFLTLGWAALVFAHYFSLHSFFDFSFLKTLRQDAGHSNFSRAWDNLEKVLPIGIWNFAVLVSIWAWGRKICLWIGFPRISTAIDLAFQMAFGIILFNSLWLGLGLNGLWMTPIFLIVSSLLMGPALWDGLRLSRQRKKPKWPKAPVLWLAAPLGLAALILFLALGQSLIPEVYFDGLVYHLSVLKFWQDRHGIVDFATHFESYYPFGAELYFLNGLWPFGGTDGDGAKLLNVAALGLTLLAAGGWVAEEAGAALGCLTGAAVLFLPWVSSTVWTTQNEVVLAFFLLLFFYALRRWTQGMTFSTRLPWALAVGLLGGAALTVKYTAIPAFAAALVALFFENPKSFNRDRWKEWALIKVMWLAALGPWLLKNFIYTGNPIYPYLSQILGGRHLPPLRFRELMENHESAFGTGMPFWKWPYELLAHHLDKTMGPLLFIF